MRRALFALSLLACGGTQAATSAEEAPVEAAPVAPEELEPITVELSDRTDASVVRSAATCQEGAPEACNGLDDDCSGTIDEGCGVESGVIQITLAWTSGADLDLYVVDPLGYTISYQNRQSPSGAVFDRESRGACGQSEGPHLENVHWQPAVRPPSGRYQVEVHHWGTCGASGPTQATVSIAVAGTIAAAYNVALAPRERHIVTVFEIP